MAEPRQSTRAGAARGGERIGGGVASSSGHNASSRRCSDTVPLLPSATMAFSSASVFFGVLRE
jgi:hypothetical protein